MADLDADYRKILKAEMQKRVQKNRRFSLRAFAKLLKCDPSYLSKLNAGKLILSVDQAAIFAEQLKLSAENRKTFIMSAAEEQTCHALYLVDPLLTDCPPEKESNKYPIPRKRTTGSR